MPPTFECHSSGFSDRFAGVKWEFGIIKSLEGPDSIIASRHKNVAALVNYNETSPEELANRMKALQKALNGLQEEGRQLNVRIIQDAPGSWIIYGDLIKLISLHEQHKLSLPLHSTAIEDFSEEVANVKKQLSRVR